MHTFCYGRRLLSLTLLVLQMARSSSSVAPIPAVVHAIGGSMGSAMGLLLFYPLERARIEMQSVAATAVQTTSASGETDESGSLNSWASAEHRLEHHTDDEEEPFADVNQVPEQPQQQTIPKSSVQVAALPKPGLLECFHTLWKRNELYRGVAPIVTTLAISNFLFFYVNEWMKQVLPNRNSKQKSYWSLLASCLAGTCNVLITNPLWLTNMRIVTGETQHSSLVPALMEIFRNEGLWRLWAGTGSSILLVSNPVLQFFAYEEFKRAQLGILPDASATSASSNPTSLTPLRAFATGALAKAIATVVTYPLQLTQAILRLQQKQQQQQQPEVGENDNSTDSSNANDKAVTCYKGILDCLLRVYQKGGVPGLYMGMKAKLLQSVMTAAFTFLTYEQILGAVYAAHQSLLARR